MVCLQMPAAITVFNGLGQAIHQNPASTKYFGDRLRDATAASAANGSDDLLAQVFVFEPEKLKRMLHDVMHPAGGRWRGASGRVPRSQQG